jgi:hypothetical protein
MSQTYTSPFTGTVIQPTDVSYYELNFSTNVQLYWPAVVNPTQIPAARIISADAASVGLEIALPQGNQGSVGTDILINNLGGEDFVVTDFEGNAAVTVESGKAHYFYLVDNTTNAGVWQTIAFGASTSVADAAALAGNGLIALAGKLQTTSNIVTISSSAVLPNTGRATTYIWTGGVGSFTLPGSASLSAGFYISFRNNGTGTLTIFPQGSSTIDSNSTITVNPGSSGFILFQQSSGNFFTVGLAPAANVTLSSATYDVDSIVGNTLDLTSYAPIIQTYVGLSGTRTVNLAVDLPSTTQLYVFINETGATSYDLELNISGSVAPPVTLVAGSVALVVSDGNSLFVITQTTTSLFYAADGTALLPAYSFISDSGTGMYLANPDVLAFTANQIQMMTIDNSNPLFPITSVYSRLRANLIDGGTF